MELKLGQQTVPEVRRWARVGFLVVCALFRCGGENQFELSLPSEELVVAAGDTMVTYLAVFGAADVAFSSEDLPTFASLENNRLVFAPQRWDEGHHEMTLTARSGVESDSKVLTVFVSKANAKPTILELRVFDAASGIDEAENTGTCMLKPYVKAVLVDADQDGVRLEAQAVPAGALPTGSATDSTELWGSSGDSLELTLTNLQPNIRHDLYFRAVDRRGAATDWQTPRDSTQSVTCVPIGIERVLVPVTARGGAYTMRVNLLGVGEAPHTLVASGLPEFASLDGDFITVDASGVATSQYHTFSLELEALGYTATRRMNEIVVYPQQPGEP